MTNLDKEVVAEERENKKLKLPKFTEFFSFGNKAAYERFIKETGRTDSNR
jgi:hypothetical protein